MAYPQKPLIMAQSAVSRGTRCLKVVWSLLQPAYFAYARSKNPGEVMRTCRLIGASATRRCNKNQHLVCWPIYTTFEQRKCDKNFIADHYFLFLFSVIILIWIVKISNIVWAYMSILVSVHVIQINSKCPFLTKWLITTIGIYRCKAFHRWINTLWFTDFKMEMSTGVSLLRTAQSLLTGRTIIWVIDHKNTIAIFYAQVKILGGFLRISRITTSTSGRSMRLQFKVVGHCIAESIPCLRLLIQ